MNEVKPSPAEQVDPERFRAGQRLTWVSVGVNVVLTIMQVIVGFLAHSMALVADAMHTLSDIVADAFVLWANRKGAEAADEEHPYGHGRYETAASLVLGLLLTVTGVGILISAAGRLQNIGDLPPVGVAAMWAAILTLIGKEGLFRYMLGVAEQLRSPMLIANAWHARADALASPHRVYRNPKDLHLSRNEAKKNAADDPLFPCGGLRPNHPVVCRRGSQLALERQPAPRPVEAEAVESHQRFNVCRHGATEFPFRHPQLRLLPFRMPLARVMLFLPKASRDAASCPSSMWPRLSRAWTRIGRLTPERTSTRPSSRKE